MRHGARGLARRAPVVTENPGDRTGIGGGALLDVPRDVPVAGRSLGTWERRVGHVANQRMPEAVLHVAFETTEMLAPHEVATLQLVERIVDGLVAGERSDDTTPERASHDRG